MTNKQSINLKKKNKQVFLVCSIVIIIVFLLIISFSSLIYIKEKKEEISKYFYGLRKATTSTYNIPAKDAYWAKEILNGGYVLHFRHAERDKWIDVQMYDVLESDLHSNGKNESRYAENDYFSEAVCLNKRGKIQAKAIGEHLTNINLPIGYVFSSVSCRARETAELAFNGYDSLHRLLVHNGPYNENNFERVSKLRNFYKSIPIQKNTNTIVSAHNGVIFCEIFDKPCNEYLSLEEGGFYVIKNLDNKLYLMHEFHNFNDFNRYFYKR